MVLSSVGGLENTASEQIGGMVMVISAKLAKRIWEDDPEMLKRLECWEQVLCVAEIDDDFLMMLTPISFQSGSGYAMASMSNMDCSPVGNSAKIQLVAAEV